MLRVTVMFAALISVVAGVTYKTREPLPLQFQNRSAARVTGMLAALRNFNEDPPAEVINSHKAVADRVLLIRSLDVVENDPRFSMTEPAASWGLAALLERAWALARPTVSETAQQAVQNWAAGGSIPLHRLNENWKEIDPTRQLKTIPLRMLAIVNRLDLGRLGAGRCPQDLVCGAEVRFVYAGVPKDNPDPYFSLILEFVVKDLNIEDFRKLAESWSSLQTKTDPVPVLSAAMALTESARIRVTGRQGSTWTFGEFEFTPTGVQQTDLTRQPNLAVGQIEQCQGTGTPLAGFLKNSDHVKVASSDYSFAASDLATKEAGILESGQAVLTLHKDLAPPEKLDGLRFALSINSCVGCHGMETRSPLLPASVIENRTLFDHVRYRKSGEPSKLSNFLTGADSGEPATGFTEFSPPVVKPCAGEAPATQHYNDLLRRHLFLYTVLHLQSNLPSEWKAALDAKGLTAWQAH